MFVVGMDVDSRLYFSLATSVIAIPTAVKVFTYTCTYFSGRSDIYAVLSVTFAAFISSFILGGITGLLLSSAGLDFMYHDSYFVIAHFHTVLSLATVFGLYFGIYALYCLVFCTSLLESQLVCQMSTMFTAALLIFMPMHTSGTKGMTRRIPEFTDVYLPSTNVSTTGLY